MVDEVQPMRRTEPTSGASPSAPINTSPVPDWVRDLLVVTAYALVAIWWIWPAPRLWSDHLVFESQGELAHFGRADAYLIVWALSPCYSPGDFETQMSGKNC